MPDSKKLWSSGVGAPLILMTAAVIQYIGASFAVTLFEQVSAGAVAWGRFAFAAVILLVWKRPRIALKKLWIPAVFGLALTSMNVVFYLSISKIPLGTAVALEFLGPVMLSAVTGRGWKVRVGVVFALVGVFLISWIGVDTADPQIRWGVFYGLLAGVFWAVYIVLGKRVAWNGSGANALGIGCATGAIVFLPLAIPDFQPVLLDGKLLLFMLAVALCSTVMPYVMELYVMGKIPTSNYALLTSLYPATSLLVGMAILRQIPTVGEVVGLVFVSVAVALATRTRESGSSPSKI
ncbi:EamA family transporter [Arcanobacterium bovis]|uniref:EamA family transporter n=1 Tax=Arcanobacterium bovis TaxID=2529275 RepID=A0A4Q9UZR3_9ACTO|nr:EamA family transporter [Arcanobacterium bovis]TBW21452.1 EamA family transporter [Arcanobacterium bovis]